MLQGLLVWLLLCTAAVAAQNEGPQISKDKIAHAISSVKADESIKDAVRDKALQLYQQAQSALKAAADRRARTQQLKDWAQSAPQKLVRLQREQAGVGKPLTKEEAADMPVSELADRIDAIASKVSELEAQLTDLHDQLTNVAQRPAEARRELAAARRQLRQLRTDASTPGQQKDVVSDAQAMLSQAKRAALGAKIELLKRELSTLDTRKQVLQARRALLRQKLQRYNKSLAAARAAFSERQEKRARRLREQVRQRAHKLTDTGPVVAQAMAHNMALVDKLVKMTRRSEALAASRARLRRKLEKQEDQFNLVQRQLQIGSGSVALAQVLLEQKRELANNRAQALDLLGQLPDLSALELRAFQLQQKRLRLEDARQYADTLIAKAKKAKAKAEAKLDAQARETLVSLLQQRREIVTRLIDASNRFVDIGRDLRAMSRQYRDTLSAFADLIEEHLFWLPSFATMDWQWVPRLLAAVPRFFQPTHWHGVWQAGLHGVRRWPWVSGVGVLLFVALLGTRGVLRRQLRQAAEPVGNVSYDTFWVTLRALGVSALLCLPWALLLALAGWLVMRAADVSTFAFAVGAALTQLAKLVLYITPFRQVCRPFGLGQKHFYWSDFGRRRLRRSLRHLLYALAAGVFVVTTTEVLGVDVLRATLGRALFIFSSLVMAWFAWYVLHPRRGVLSDVFAPQRRSHWLLGYVWMPLTVGVALFMGALAAWGYYYTALQLESRFFYSAGLIGVSIIVYHLIIRWVTVAERRLALARAVRKREEAREARATREAAAAAGEGTPDSLDSVEIDLVQITEQTRSLIRTVVAVFVGVGLWFLWIDLLPALSQVNEISLWQYVITVGGESQVRNVSLGALLLALAVGLFTALAGRNLPGFLEITVLRQFSLEPGSRYAIAKLFQYAIVVIGLLVAVTLIGFSWSSIQWLVAALGVGLGFGLQEIFANFISGLVILFERPVRVGDTASVGTLTGTVSRIRIRATTITDWDNKEVIIPNKTFITETVVNWTLTDAVTRLVVRVSVARDADTTLAQRLISDAIDAEADALDEPAPSVFIVGFEEGQIVFEARVFFHDLYNLLPLQHALYRRIKDAFAQHDIEISFPQKDLHLRSMDGSIREVFAPTSGQHTDPDT